MSNPRYDTYVAVFTNKDGDIRTRFVTDLPARNTAEWNVGKPAMQIAESYAKDIVLVTGMSDKFIVAAGDFGNDRAMIADADLGVAVENAIDSVKEAADLVVRDNNHSPMSDIIDHIRKL